MDGYRRSSRLALCVALAGFAAACGSNSPQRNSDDGKNRTGVGIACVDWGLYVNGCPANTPSQKLVLNPVSGIPNAYIVMLKLPQPDVGRRAAELAAKYSGQVSVAWSEVCGFSLKVADASAPALSAESDVCWVEQDAMGSVDGVQVTP